MNQGPLPEQAPCSGNFSLFGRNFQKKNNKTFEKWLQLLENGCKM